MSSGTGRDDHSKLSGSFLLHRLLVSCFLDLANVFSSKNLGVAVSLGAVLSLGWAGKGKARWTGPVCSCSYDPGMPSYCGKVKNKISKQGNFKRLKEEAGGGFSASDRTALHFQFDPPNIFNKGVKCICQKKRQPVLRNENSPGFGRQFAFVFELELYSLLPGVNQVFSSPFSCFLAFLQ